MRLLDPTLDIVFKLLLLRNPELLRAKLEAVLGHPVLDFEVMNPELPGELSADKLVVLDVRVHLVSGERVDVEMQARSDSVLVNRVLYYAARDYSGQLRRGDDYARLTPTISILWVNARLFPELPRFHLRFQLLETTSGVPFSHHLTVHVLQLPEIASSSEQHATLAERALTRWGRFFSAPDEASLTQLAKEDPIMAAAVDALERLSQDPEAQRLAREREDSLHFYNMSLAQAKEDGVVKGRVEGVRLNQLETIAKLCDAFGIELTPERRAALDAPNTDLGALVSTLIVERRWP